MSDLSPIYDFLACRTPAAWLEAAVARQDVLLIDHAHCEKKAASTALMLLYRYVEHYQLLHTLSRIAREELRHFEQVIALLKKRDIAYQHLSPARYAKGLHQHVRTREPGKLVDTLIIGAYIEARSCERFAALIPYLDEELASFYQSLLRSEARHFQHYLSLAAKYADEDIQSRVEFFAPIEAELIDSLDEHFRFHSGYPDVG